MSFQAVHVFYYLFYHMERSGVLDPTNEIHLFALHFVFVPRINKKLMLFWEGHNRGPISSEHNSSPEQLWVRGILSNAHSDRRSAIEFSSQVGTCSLLSYSTVYVMSQMLVMSSYGDWVVRVLDFGVKSSSSTKLTFNWSATLVNSKLLCYLSFRSGICYFQYLFTVLQ